jgi:hypothetical protein
MVSNFIMTDRLVSSVWPSILLPHHFSAVRRGCCARMGGIGRTRFACAATRANRQDQQDRHNER